jgi:hypothetical protein
MMKLHMLPLKRKLPMKRLPQKNLPQKRLLPR